MVCDSIFYMEITKTHKIIISVLSVAILFGLYIFFTKKGDNTTPMVPNQNETATTTTGADGQVKVGGNGNYTIEQVPVNEGRVLPQPVPNLDRAVTVYAGAIIAPEAKALAVTKVKELQTLLKKDNWNAEAWIYLGMYQKQGGDYEGAVLSWKYVGKLAPTDFISVANLGNLYAYFIKDNAQAEVYYKKAIANAPTIAYLYTQLAEVYRDVFKDLTKARAIVNQGLTKIPNDPNLLQLKASLN